MKVSELNDWLTLAANLGVLAGLFILIFELNQNTQVSKATAYQDLISQISEINFAMASDNEIAGIFTRNARSSELSEEALDRYFSFARVVIRHGDMAYYQYQLGLIDESRLLSALGPLRGYLLSENGKRVWESMRSNLVPEYTGYIDDLMRGLQPDHNYWVRERN